MKKILRHKEPHHLDDQLAVGLIILAHENEQIEITEGDNDTPKSQFDFVVDVGGEYDGERYFDHHQNLNLESSFLLVLKKFFPEIYSKAIQLPFVRFIDLKDRFGVKEAERQTGIHTENVGFFTFLIQDLYSPEALKELSKAFLKWIDREYETEEVIKSTEILWLGSVKIAVCYHENPQIGKIMLIHKPDVLICNNLRTPNTCSIIKNSNSNLYNEIDVDEILPNLKSVFKHPNAFMRVVHGTPKELRKLLTK